MFFESSPLDTCYHRVSTFFAIVFLNDCNETRCKKRLPHTNVVGISTFSCNVFRCVPRPWNLSLGTSSYEPQNTHMVHSTVACVRKRFCPQRSYGQAVVTGVSPSPPRYLPSIWSRMGFSNAFQVFHARRLASNFANTRSYAFGLWICRKEHRVRFDPTTSTLTVSRLTIGLPGTPAYTIEYV